MVQKRLQLQLAEANHVKVDDEALNRTILNIAAQNKMSLSEFREVLERDGVRFEEYRENVRSEMTLDSCANVRSRVASLSPIRKSTNSWKRRRSRARATMNIAWGIF